MSCSIVAWSKLTRHFSSRSFNSEKPRSTSTLVTHTETAKVRATNVVRRGKVGRSELDLLSELRPVDGVEQGRVQRSEGHRDDIDLGRAAQRDPGSGRVARWRQHSVGKLLRDRLGLVAAELLQPQNPKLSIPWGTDAFYGELTCTQAG